MMNSNILEIIERGWSILDKSQDAEEYRIFLGAICDHFHVSAGKTTVLEPKLFSNSAKKTLSNTYGYDEFPFHSDGANLFIPPRIILLRYLGSVDSLASTLLIDGNRIADELGGKEALNEMYFVKGDPNSFYSSILSADALKIPIIRYNSMVMKRILVSESPIFERLLSKIAPVQIHWKVGMTVVIDNWRILHARQAVPTNEIESRQIERIFFNYEYCI